jgi:ABC-type sulfate transport system permease subunit
MNMVAVLTVPMMVIYDNMIVKTVHTGAQEVGYSLPANFATKGIDLTWIIAVTLSVVFIVWAVWQSKRQAPAYKEAMGDE